MERKQIINFLQSGRNWIQTEEMADKNDEAFDKRLQDLAAFKSKFGHCDVPYSYPENPSLGQWCSDMRSAYNAIQKGKKTSHTLSPERMKRLEEIGVWILHCWSFLNQFSRYV